MTAGIMLFSSFAIISPAQAVTVPDNNFSLQVTPSPLVTTVKPGEPKTIELKIRNTSTASEQLKIEARSFSYDSRTGDVAVDEKTPPEIAPWLSFSAPTFTVTPGTTYSQNVRVALPKESGFSYHFALLISRKDTVTSKDADGRLLQGTVAVFGLVNVDRPGATRSLQIEQVSSESNLYEYLPATFSIRLKNTGNTIVQPYGNVYIQRGDNDTSPLATLKVNETNGYLLPGTERTLQASWNDGFPTYKTITDNVGHERHELSWDPTKLSEFRIGSYTAKVVAVYNDGVRDVPVTASVNFWVLPWKSIAAVLIFLIIIIVLFRLYIKRRTDRAVQKALSRQRRDDQHKAPKKG